MDFFVAGKLFIVALAIAAPHQSAAPRPPGGGGRGGGGGGGTSATKCATDGSDYKYTEAVAGSTHTVVTPWCPNHYFDDGNLNPNSAYTKGDVTLTMPASPMLESSATDDVTDQGGGVGVLFNGAMLYSPYAGANYPLTGYETSATKLEGDTFDKCGCHSSSTSNAGYHCHIPPSCLLHQLGQNSKGHSPQVGWAPDGFPIYGPRTIDGLKIKLCSESTNANSEYCLDECSGLNKEIPGLDDFKYRYYIKAKIIWTEVILTTRLRAPTRRTVTAAVRTASTPLDRAVLPVHAKMLPRMLSKWRNMLSSHATIPTCSNSATAGTTSAYTAVPAYPSGLPCTMAKS